MPVTEHTIITLLKNHRRYKLGMDVLRDCSGMADSADLEKNERYCLLKKRILLIQYWLSLLTKEEATVLTLHLMEDLTWQRIAAKFDESSIEDIACDERTLQRTQTRAIKKLHAFMREVLGDSMDYLGENSVGE